MTKSCELKVEDKCGYLHPEHSLTDMKFAETVAVNRGVNIRVFASVRDAEQWLGEAPVGKTEVLPPSRS